MSARPRWTAQYMAATGVTQSAYIGYYIHNMHFVAYARAMQGRMTESIRAADEIAAGSEADGGRDARDGGCLRCHAAVRTGALPALGRPAGRCRARRRSSPSPRRCWHYARALAFAGERQARGSASASRPLSTPRAPRCRASAMWGNNKPAEVLAVAAEVLAARLADIARGRGRTTGSGRSNCRMPSFTMSRRPGIIPSANRWAPRCCVPGRAAGRGGRLPRRAPPQPA